MTGSRTVTVRWLPPPLEQQNGQIVYYLLVITDRQLGSNTELNSTTTSFMATGLKEYNNYSCIVAAATTVGLGPYSLPVRFTTLQGGKHPFVLRHCCFMISDQIIMLWIDILTMCLVLMQTHCILSQTLNMLYLPFVCPVPSAPPQSLSGIAQSSTVVRFTWSAPPIASIPGILQNYVLKLREIETGQVWTFVSVAAHINIGSLHPYYNYECKVAAHTIAGTGPYTEAVIAQTQEAGVMGTIFSIFL